MAILNNNPLVGASGNQGGYNINNSLRFRSSASAFLNRTPASAGSRTTWTWSGWVKRGSLGTHQTIFSSNTSSVPNLNDYITVDTNNILTYYSVLQGTSVNIQLSTTQVFRDPSAWYHIILAVDTAQATASNRVKIYVNGSQVTAFSTATYPSLNYVTGMNATVIHNIGNRSGTSEYFDGYLAETNFIDGQALTPSSFGETDTTTGVWKPKAYTSTYGTNGFYLKFADASAATAAAIGKDSSGNGNNWTPNNISVTSGTTYDAMKDVPTNTSATVANYCVWNPINNNNTNTITNGNLSGSNNGGTYATMSLLNGKYYWEYYWTSGTAIAMGISPTNRNIYFSNVGSGAVSYFNDGQKSIDGTNSSYGASYTTSDVIGVALDTNAGTITFYKNNVSQGAISLPSGITEWVASIWSRSGTVGFNANFGQQPFTYTPPTGYVALNTYNLPTPTILQGNKYMDATAYTGNGVNRSIANGGSFLPDLLWIKKRNSAFNHRLNNTITGTSATLFTNNTDAETTWGGVDAFLSAGFSVSNDSSTNANGDTYVAWQWQAGSSTVTNTSGSISSQVRANTTAGFSVVTYAGNSTSSATVGHGLGVSPSMVIIKNRSSVTNWVVRHSSLSSTQNVSLNTTDAAYTVSSGTANGGVGAFTSTTFGFISGTTGLLASNQTSNNYVAYCWAEIAGFSRFGSYVANASSDGPFIYTGFRPRWIMFKRSTSATNWYVIDTSISPINASTAGLYPNTSAGDSTEGAVDILSNGFKCRVSSGAFNFPSGETFIYAAFAENPFKNSLAR